MKESAAHPLWIHESVSDKENMLVVPLDWHEEIELLYFKKGRFRLMLNLQELEIGEECVCFVNPGELRRLEALTEGAREFSVRFHPELLHFFAEDRLERELLRPLREGQLRFPRKVGISDIGNEQVLKLLEEMMHRAGQFSEREPSIRSSTLLTFKGVSDRLIFQAELLKLIGIMDAYGMIHRSVQRVEDRQVRTIKAAIAYIQENFHRKIYIRNLSELSHLNEQYFIRFFKRVMGMPPLEYINHYRIQQAKRRLRDSGDKAYEVAEQCGFHNIGNFIKVFRSVTGMTPHQYRESYKEKKMTYYYPAVITKKEEGYRVDIIDLEDCYGEGKDLDEALENARYSGVNWLLVELEDQMEFPAQTHLEDITLEPNQKSTMIALLMPRNDGWDE